MLKAILFDVDGTLANTETLGHRVAFNQSFQEHNVLWDWSIDKYIELLSVTGGKERILHYYQNHLEQNKQQEFSTLAKNKNLELSDFIKKIHLRKNEIYKDLVMQGEVDLRAGVKRIFAQALEQKIKIAIVTTTSYDNIVNLVSATLGSEAMNYFDFIASGENVQHKKPAPDLYNLTLEKMQLNPNEVIAIEDSYPGLQSALTAEYQGVKGIKTLITQNSITQNQNFTGALLVVNSLGDENNPTQIVQKQDKVPDLTQNYIDVTYLKKLIEG